MSEEQKDEKITINGEEHLVSSFNDQQKYFVAQIRALQEKETSIKFDLDPIILAKQSFSDLLVKSFEQATKDNKEEEN